MLPSFEMKEFDDCSYTKPPDAEAVSKLTTTPSMEKSVSILKSLIVINELHAELLS
jgi:hypothetical protein